MKKDTIDRIIKPRTKEIIFPDSEFTKGELIGAFAGDGNYFHDMNGKSSHHRIRYCLSYKDDKAYAEYLRKLITSMGLNPWIFTKYNKFKKPSGLDVTFNSVRFYSFIKDYLVWSGIKTYSVNLSRDINNYNKDFLFGFVRGAMDTDGSMGKYNASFAVTSEKFTKNIQGILSLIEIQTTIKIRKRKNKSDLHIIRVRKKYLKLFEQYIGFSNPRKQQKLLRAISN